MHRLYRRVAHGGDRQQHDRESDADDEGDHAAGDESSGGSVLRRPVISSASDSQPQTCTSANRTLGRPEAKTPRTGDIQHG